MILILNVQSVVQRSNAQCAFYKPVRFGGISQVMSCIKAIIANQPFLDPLASDEINPSRYIIKNTGSHTGPADLLRCFPLILLV
jgi:hypothetical protein